MAFLCRNLGDLLASNNLLTILWWGDHFMSNVEKNFSRLGFEVSRGAKLPHFTNLYQGAGKRIFDIVFVLIAIPFLAPLMIGLVIFLHFSGGQPFFGHTRIGHNGKAFKCWKFRSMVTNGDALLAHTLATDPEARAQWKCSRKLESDPRVTRIGHFLRRSSIDELPQLWNVLKGEMSIVGPRPIPEDELKLYGPHMVDYVKLRPGLTGLWQVNGRGKVDFQTRVKMDVRYKNSLCFWNDFKIIVGTVGAVVGQTGR